MNISSLFYMNNTQRGPDSTTGLNTVHLSLVYLSIPKERDRLSDMNALFHYTTLKFGFTSGL